MLISLSLSASPIKTFFEIGTVPRFPSLIAGVGAFIIARAMIEPLKRIAENSGKNGIVIVEHVQQKDFSFGYDAAKDSFGDMFKFGIIDPAKVVRSALQNAASIASMILTTECIIVEKQTKV
jgi:chaperonin GroEL